MRIRDEDRLWAGARVRWAGPALWPDGVQLIAGSEGEVVDPGRWGVPSISPLTRRGARQRRGVGVTFGGRVVDVPRRWLEVVPPFHDLQPCADVGVAAWLRPKATVDDRVSTVVLADLGAVVRLLHPFTQADGRPRRWRDAGLTAAEWQAAADPREVEAWERDGLTPPQVGQVPPSVGGVLLNVLADVTGTPDEVYLAVWEGWGDVLAARWPGAAPLDHGWRRYWLLRGPLAAALDPVGVLPRGTQGGQLWWPADHAWLVTTEIDDAWTYVSGPQRLTQALLDHPDLEAQPATLNDRNTPTPP